MVEEEEAHAWLCLKPFGWSGGLWLFCPLLILDLHRSPFPMSLPGPLHLHFPSLCCLPGMRLFHMMGKEQATGKRLIEVNAVVHMCWTTLTTLFWRKLYIHASLTVSQYCMKDWIIIIGGFSFEYIFWFEIICICMLCIVCMTLIS